MSQIHVTNVLKIKVFFIFWNDLNYFKQTIIGMEIMVKEIYCIKTKFEIKKERNFIYTLTAQPEKNY